MKRVFLIFVMVLLFASSVLANEYYIYDQVQGGSRWNMQQRIWIATGRNPLYSFDAQVSGVMKTHIVFDIQLTPEQKAAMDAVMADYPTYPPDSIAQGKTVLAISDIYEDRLVFQSRIGVPFQIFYNEGFFGSGVLSRIELHFDRALSANERNAVMSEFSKIITLKDGRF